MKYYSLGKSQAIFIFGQTLGSDFIYYISEEKKNDPHKI